MKVFVTGATGFTGAHLVRRLLERGHSVVGLDIGRGLAFEELSAAGAELHLGSVTDQSLLDRLVPGCERVYHLAAAFRKVNLPKSAYWQANVDGTRLVLEAARRHGVDRVLYCSTCGVHGNVEDPPADESAPIRPADYYQFTKWEGERVCQEFARDGLWVSIVRPAAIYGPGDPERFLMLYRRVARGRFIMVGGGRTHYHPLYVTNLIDAMELALERDEARGNAYLIADDHSLAIGDLVKEIGKVLETDVRFVRIPYLPMLVAATLCELAYKPLPWEPPLFRRRLDWFVQWRSFDITAARRDLGYVPRVDLATGLAETAAWYRTHGYI
jgi:nucleoside-diphosphate-sugar epimerase